MQKKLDSLSEDFDEQEFAEFYESLTFFERAYLRYRVALTAIKNRFLR